MTQRQFTQNSRLSMICTNILRLNCFKVERRTAFFGEDIFFLVPPGNVSEVVFKPRTNNSAEVVLLQAGKVVSPRCHISSLGHLVLEDAKEEDEGLYIFRNISGPNTPKHIVLAVKGELSVHLSVFSSSRLLLLCSSTDPVQWRRDNKIFVSFQVTNLFYYDFILLIT